MSTEAAAFSQTSLFLDQFPANFKCQIENGISDVLITFTSSFSNCRTMDSHAYGTVLPLSREKVL